MRLEWLEDIIAVIETGSLSAAATRRCVTQPAFSRRVRAIEEQLGAELFDRERKPVVLRPLAASHQEDFRRLARDMRELLAELRRQGRDAHNRIVIASQHALTATFAPSLVQTLLARIDTTVRLRSANRDECLAMLMTKQVDLLIHYQAETEAPPDLGDFTESAPIGDEMLIPVAAPAQARALGGDLPIIAYPGDAFLGHLFNEEILPRLPEPSQVRRKVETALTLAALELAEKGIGVAWIPESLTVKPVAEGALVDLSDRLPSARMKIVAVRLVKEHSATEEQAWAELLARDTRDAPVRAAG